jgi:hypothetical protein
MRSRRCPSPGREIRLPVQADLPRQPLVPPPTGRGQTCRPKAGLSFTLWQIRIPESSEGCWPNSFMTMALRSRHSRPAITGSFIATGTSFGLRD